MKRFILLFIFSLFFFPLFAQADIIDGDLIRADLDVYIVKLMGDKKFKRLILNPEIFNQYAHLKWENIKDIDQSIVDQYIVSDLVRAIDDKKVYRLYPIGDIGEKRWIKTANDFLDLGFDWDSIYEINSFERNYYIPGSDLIADTAPVPEPEPEVPFRDPITINVPDDYSIQLAIDNAINGDTISVNSGTYTEDILINKNIELIGNYAVASLINGKITITDAQDFLIQRFTIKNENGKAIYCYGENLSKGSIKNTFIINSNSGIYADGNCDLNIVNNLIYDNEEAGIFIKNGVAEIINNTIDGNLHGIWSEDSDLTVMNNIITYNVGSSNSTGIYHSGDGVSNNMYNNVWNNGFEYGGDAKAGSGSLVLDPKFVQRTSKNFKLKTGTTGSYCLDHGNPSFIYNDRVFSSNTARNDMGAYGGPDNLGWTP